MVKYLIVIAFSLAAVLFMAVSLHFSRYKRRRTWNIKLNKDYTLLSLILKKVHVTEHPEAVSLYGAGAEGTE
jgi:hypothetical protein